MLGIKLNQVFLWRRCDRRNWNWGSLVDRLERRWRSMLCNGWPWGVAARTKARARSLGRRWLEGWLWLRRNEGLRFESLRWSLKGSLVRGGLRSEQGRRRLLGSWLRRRRRRRSRCGLCRPRLRRHVAHT